MLMDHESHSWKKYKILEKYFSILAMMLRVIVVKMSCLRKGTTSGAVCHVIIS